MVYISQSKIIIPEQKEAKKMLKLYVLKDVFYDYTEGIGFALAENENEARELILNTRLTSEQIAIIRDDEAKGLMIDNADYNDCKHARIEVYDLKPIAFSISGGA